jgi:hypothetical protein
MVVGLRTLAFLLVVAAAALIPAPTRATPSSEEAQPRLDEQPRSTTQGAPAAIA